MKVYNTPRDKLNYMNTLNLKIELNKQSKNIPATIKKLSKKLTR